MFPLQNEPLLHAETVNREQDLPRPSHRPLTPTSSFSLGPPTAEASPQRTSAPSSHLQTTLHFPQLSKSFVVRKLRYEEIIGFLSFMF